MTTLTLHPLPILRACLRTSHGIACLVCLWLATGASAMANDNSPAVFSQLDFQPGRGIFPQNRISLTIMVDPLQMAQANYNLQTGLNWKNMGLTIAGTYYSSVEADPSSGFTRQNEQYSFAIAARVFPFGRHMHRVFASQPQSRLGCYGFPSRKKSLVESGIYLAPGVTIQRLKFLYVPNTELQSPVSEFPWTVRNNGPSIELGYQVRVAFITAEVGYSWFFGFPKGYGTVDPFGDQLYTSTFPIRYKLQNQLQLKLGFSFFNKNK